MSAFACIRADLDYVPWDTVAAEEWGHGEPAMLLRLLSFGRERGLRVHFFSSTRSTRAFPAAIEAILDEGHDLDWLCRVATPTEVEIEASRALFKRHSHAIRGSGFSVSGPISAAGFEFVSAGAELENAGPRHFPQLAPTAINAAQSGQSARAWRESVIEHAQQCSDQANGFTLAIRPQVLSRFDPTLSHLDAILRAISELEMPLRTLRQVIDHERPPDHEL